MLISSFLGFWQEKRRFGCGKRTNENGAVALYYFKKPEEKRDTCRRCCSGRCCDLICQGCYTGDSLILDSQELFVDEAAFTGETYPAEKNAGVLPADTPFAKRSNALFMGSHVFSGKASALIIKTGKQTEFDQISAGLQARVPETDFEKGIRKFGYMLMEITLLLVIIIFGINVFLRKPVLYSFLFSLALAVGLTPQLLPAIISVYRCPAHGPTAGNR